MTKPGINKSLKCRKCGHNVGYVRIKPKLKWKSIKWALCIAFLFELIASFLVFTIFILFFE